jgi:hypothetical protein
MLAKACYDKLALKMAKTHATLLPAAFRQRMGEVWNTSSFAYSPD